MREWLQDIKTVIFRFGDVGGERVSVAWTLWLPNRFGRGRAALDRAVWLLRQQRAAAGRVVGKDKLQERSSFWWGNALSVTLRRSGFLPVLSYLQVRPVFDTRQCPILERFSQEVSKMLAAPKRLGSIRAPRTYPKPRPLSALLRK